jgi:hypothetical protein
MGVPEETLSRSHRWQQLVYKGVAVYGQKLKTQQLLNTFDTEIQKWIDMGVLIPYKEEEMGIPICTLT